MTNPPRSYFNLLSLDNSEERNYNVIIYGSWRSKIDAVVKSKMIKIGNSRGIRIPRAIIEQAGLTDHIEMVVQGDQIIIRSSSKPREGWAELFSALVKEYEDEKLDDLILTAWDEQEWEW